MTLKYSPPSIVKIGNPLYTKHGSSAQTYHFVREEIDGVSIEELTKKFGSPLFVFSEKAIRLKYRQAYQAISNLYPKVQFGWSYKTNYINAICKIFHDEGAIAEVVSHYEYEKARSLGIDGKNIIYNGPLKSKESLKKAASEGAQIHIDHFHEIDDLEEVAQSISTPIRVGIRLNLNSGIYPIWSRFGFNLENGQALAAAKRISGSKKLKLCGIHTHIGTFILDAQAYARAGTKMVEFAKAVETLTQTPLEFIDMGGGFASRIHLKGVYQPPEVAVPSLESYAEALCRPFSCFLSRPKPPTLFMELGRYLIDESGYLITSVFADKLLPDGRRAYILDAGVNLLYTSTWYKYRIELGEAIEAQMEPSILNGPLCMNIDIVDEAIMLPRLKRNHKLILSPVGAYNVTQWMQFIQYRPNIILIGEDKKPRVIRLKEELSTITAQER